MKRLALKIVRDNMIDPDDWIIDSFTISSFFEPCECKEMGIWHVGQGLCDRCADIEYIDRAELQWQMLYNAITCVCKM